MSTVAGKRVRETFEAVVGELYRYEGQVRVGIREMQIAGEKFKTGDRVRVTVERISKGAKR
jgi:hypothetical protein